MTRLTVRLFGKLSVQRDSHAIAGLDARKVQELFCYLLLYRDRPHARESLANVFWSDGATSQTRAYLRKTLWQLQSAFEVLPDQGTLLEVDDEWVQLHAKPDLWLDVAVFEQVFAMVRGVRGRNLDEQKVGYLQDAVDLYPGDLLEGWYSDWCIYERERLQSMYLMMLDKLMGYCEAHQLYEAGISYGARILRYDVAHERTHQRLMRLYYLAGDRTAALRQYQRCVATLAKELNVPPDDQTVTLYKQLCSNALASAPHSMPPSPILLERLIGLHSVLADAQQRIRQDIQVLQDALRSLR